MSRYCFRVVIGKIHTHGCLTTMLRRLNTHVHVILFVFAVAGAFLAVVELLGVVLACCLASQFAQLEEEEDWDYDYGPDGRHPQHSRQSGEL